jgi:hypothetical protein
MPSGRVSVNVIVTDEAFDQLVDAEMAKIA